MVRAGFLFGLAACLLFADACTEKKTTSGNRACVEPKEIQNLGRGYDPFTDRYLSTCHEWLSVDIPRPDPRVEFDVFPVDGFEDLLPLAGIPVGRYFRQEPPFPLTLPIHDSGVYLAVRAQIVVAQVDALPGNVLPGFAAMQRERPNDFVRSCGRRYVESIRRLREAVFLLATETTDLEEFAGLREQFAEISGHYKSRESLAMRLDALKKIKQLRVFDLNNEMETSLAGVFEIGKSSFPERHTAIVSPYPNTNDQDAPDILLRQLFATTQRRNHLNYRLANPTKFRHLSPAQLQSALEATTERLAFIRRRVALCSFSIPECVPVPSLRPLSVSD